MSIGGAELFYYGVLVKHVDVILVTSGIRDIYALVAQVTLHFATIAPLVMVIAAPMPTPLSEKS